MRNMIPGYREAAAEQVPHHAVSPRLDLGIRDGMSRGVSVLESLQ